MSRTPVEIRRPLGDHASTAFLYYGSSCVESMALLDAASVHCVVTSPPYWGLRDYGGPEQVWDGDPECSHDWGGSDSNQVDGGGRFCRKCSAWLGQFGLEPTPQLYVAHVVEIFREVRRVLRQDGTVWLNLGDSYTSGGRNFRASDRKDLKGGRENLFYRPPQPVSLKEKDLVGIPWRVAFALQEDGWYLRSDIVWAKGNCMPESVADRPTRSHEYLFLFSKNASYFYDNDAIKERARLTNGNSKGGEEEVDVGVRNKRTVWNVNSLPYRGAHFAVFPPKLVEPCVLAGSSEKGCCPMCWAPWKRQVETEGGRDWRKDVMHSVGIPGELSGDGSYKRGRSSSPLNDVKQRKTVGWSPSCGCPQHEPVPCRVLDPFSGSGTTGQVALDHGRDYIGLDVNQSYVNLATARILGESAPPPEEVVTPQGSILEILGVEGE